VTQSVGQGKSLAYWLLGMVAGLLLLLFVIETAKKQETTAPMTTFIPTQEDPKYAIARDFVRGKLISPQAAQFPIGPDAYHLTSLGPDRSQVSSSVSVHFTDGEIVKRWFTVTMRYIGSGRYVLDGRGVELFEEGSKKLRQE